MEILKEVDATLDELIKNQGILTEIGDDILFELEIVALKKTQESLFAKLIFLTDQYRSCRIRSTSCRRYQRVLELEDCSIFSLAEVKEAFFVKNIRLRNKRLRLGVEMAKIIPTHPF